MKTRKFLSGIFLTLVFGATSFAQISNGCGAAMYPSKHY
jgi:hypothetical protein